MLDTTESTLNMLILEDYLNTSSLVAWVTVNALHIISTKFNLISFILDLFIFIFVSNVMKHIVLIPCHALSSLVFYQGCVSDPRQGRAQSLYGRCLQSGSWSFILMIFLLPAVPTHAVSYFHLRQKIKGK